MKRKLLILCLLGALLCATALAETTTAPPPEGHLRVTGLVYLNNTDIRDMTVLLDTGEEVTIKAPVPADFFEGATVSDDNGMVAGTKFNMSVADSAMIYTFTEGFMRYHYTFEGEPEPREFPLGIGTLLAYARDGDAFTFTWTEQPEEVTGWIAAQDAAE